MMAMMLRSSVIIGTILSVSVFAGCQTVHGTKSAEEFRKCEKTRDLALGLNTWEDFKVTGGTDEQAKAELALLEQHILVAFNQCIEN